MPIVFYISGHGFGHASRDVEVMNAMGRMAASGHVRNAAEPIVLRTAVEPALLARTLQVPYTLAPGPCDTGIVQATSVSHDDAATVDAAIRFYDDFASKVEHEAAFLANVGATQVVGDIPPLAFAAAARAGVPSVALGNFSWDWIYETHPGFAAGAPHVLDTIREAYRQADLALRLPLSGGFETFQRVERVPLIARRPTQARDDTRRHFGVPLDGPLVLLSFGGYGLSSLDLGKVDALGDWTVVTTDRASPHSPPDVRGIVRIRESSFLSGPFRYEDLVAAADVVMTKPGYGIIAECIASGTAMLYTSRGQFREYDLLVQELPRYVRARFIDQAALFAGTWRHALEALLNQPAPRDTIATNGAEVVAEILLARV